MLPRVLPVSAMTLRAPEPLPAPEPPCMPATRTASSPVSPEGAPRAPRGALLPEALPPSSPVSGERVAPPAPLLPPRPNPKMALAHLISPTDAAPSVPSAASANKGTHDAVLPAHQLNAHQHNHHHHYARRLKLELPRIRYSPFPTAPAAYFLGEAPPRVPGHAEHAGNPNVFAPPYFGRGARAGAGAVRRSVSGGVSGVSGGEASAAALYGGAVSASGGGVGAGEPKAKRPWTEAEDGALRALVLQLGPGLWAAMAQQIPGRTGKQVRERWLNHLSPGVTKRPWSPEEDAVILDHHARLGNCWSRIAKALAGRSDNSVKNRFYTTLRRRLGPPVPTHVHAHVAPYRGGPATTPPPGTSRKRPRTHEEELATKRGRIWE